jgi:tetratricopeptide (TPR) repeat protein
MASQDARKIGLKPRFSTDGDKFHIMGLKNRARYLFDRDLMTSLEYESSQSFTDAGRGICTTFIADTIGRARSFLFGSQSYGHGIAALPRLRCIILVVLLLGFRGSLYSDVIPQANSAPGINDIQKALSQLQSEIKNLQSSVKELVRVMGFARHAKEQGIAALAQLVGAAEVTSATPNDFSVWQRAQEAYEQGRHSENLKVYGPAIEHFTEAIDLDPKNDSAFLHRGCARYYLGDFAGAVSDISLSIKLQPNNSRAYMMRASALVSIGRTNDAIADVTQAIQRNPNDAENYLNRADLDQQIGLTQKALDDYGQAIQMAPDSVKAYLGRASILRTQGQLPQSLSDCSKAIQFNPADPAAYACRAQFYLATGAPQPALEDISRAMLIGQNPVVASTLLGAAARIIDSQAARLLPNASARSSEPPATVAPSAPAQLTQSRGAAAVSVSPPRFPPATSIPFNQQPRTARDAHYFYGKGRSSSEKESFEEAVRAFNQAIQIDPTYSLALNARGYAQLRLRHYQDTIDDCSQSIRLNPRYANAYHNRSVAKRALGDRKGARDDLRRETELENIAREKFSKSPPRPF